MAPIYTSDWFSHNIPTWTELLVPRFAGRSGLRMLEIGSYEGRSANWIAENLLTGEDCELDCVDTFQGSMEHTYDDELRLRFWENTKHNTQIVDCKMTSREYFRESYCNEILAFDLIYIDGSHTAEDVLQDGLNAWRVLRDGGVMVFDDLAWDLYEQPWLLPAAGIAAFMNVYLEHTKVLHQGHQLIIEKALRVEAPRIREKYRNTPLDPQSA